MGRLVPIEDTGFRTVLIILTDWDLTKGTERNGKDAFCVISATGDGRGARKDERLTVTTKGHTRRITPTEEESPLHSVFFESPYSETERYNSKSVEMFNFSNSVLRLSFPWDRVSLPGLFEGTPS